MKCGKMIMKCVDGDVKAGTRVRVSSAKSGRSQQLWKFVTVTERGE